MPLSHPIFHQIPFLRISIAFISGMLLASYMPYWGIGIGCVLISLLLGGISLLPSCQYQDWLSGVALLLALVGLGFGTYYLYPQTYLTGIPPTDSYQATILQAPVEKPKTYRVPCSLQNSRGDSYASLLYLAKDSLSGSLKEGDVFWVRPKNFKVLTSSYYQQQGIYSSAYVPSSRWTPLKGSSTSSMSSIFSTPSIFSFNSLKQKALKARQSLLTTLRSHTDSTTYSIGSALCLGDKSQLSPSVKKEFANTGSSHILAVSGLHVGILYMALSYVFQCLRYIRPLRWMPPFCIILCLWGYAFICGLPPSILRAVIMFSIVTLGQVLDEHPKSLNTVLLTAVALLIYHPPYLFHIGFQLSFAAVISILLFYPLLKQLLHPKNKFLHWAWNLSCVSVAAQMGTAPLTLYYFHQFPLYFLLSNFWVVPLGTGLIYSSLGLWVLAIFGIGHWVSPILAGMTQLLLQGVHFLSTLPGAIWEGIFLDKIEVLLLYICLLFTYLFWQKKRVSYLYGQLFMVILLLLGGIVQIISNIFFIFVD